MILLFIIKMYTLIHCYTNIIKNNITFTKVIYTQYEYLSMRQQSWVHIQYNHTHTIRYSYTYSRSYRYIQICVQYYKCIYIYI